MCKTGTNLQMAQISKYCVPYVSDFGFKMYIMVCDNLTTFTDFTMILFKKTFLPRNMIILYKLVSQILYVAK